MSTRTSSALVQSSHAPLAGISTTDFPPYSSLRFLLRWMSMCLPKRLTSTELRGSQCECDACPHSKAVRRPAGVAGLEVVFQPGAGLCGAFGLALHHPEPL